MNVKLENIFVPQSENSAQPIATIVVESFNTIGLHIYNHSARALATLSFEAAFTDLLETTPIVVSAADYTTPVYPAKRASGNLNVLAGGSGGFVILDVSGIHAITIRGTSSHIDGSDISVWGQCN